MLLLCNYPAGLFSWPEEQDSSTSFIPTWNFLPFCKTVCQLIKGLALLWTTKWLWSFWPILWMWNLPSDCCGLETLTPPLCSPNVTFRKEEETCISHLSLVFGFFFAAQPDSSFALGLWCWYICKLTNLTVTASCCFLPSLCPGVWLCTLILQGYKSPRIALNYCSRFLLVTSASKFHPCFEVTLLSDPTNHTYLSKWSHHCSDNRRYILWTQIKHISGASDGL